MLFRSEWTVRGLPTNFVSTASAHTVDGQLLGAPAQVRFTPVRWTWSYGDGTSRTSSTGGATWAELGRARFDPTATSHIYLDRGHVTVEASVEYAAEYRFAGPAWTAVDGTLPVAAPPQSLLVVTGSTVLVNRPCTDSTGRAC